MDVDETDVRVAFEEPPNVPFLPFTIVLLVGDERKACHDTDTRIEDGEVLALVETWKKEGLLSEWRAGLLVREIKNKRDDLRHALAVRNAC